MDSEMERWRQAAMGAMGAGLRFNCTKCGMCCNSAPTLTVEEGLALADAFVMAARVRFAFTPPSAPSVRFSELGGDEGGIPVYVGLIAEPLNWIGACPALDGEVCAIHQRRPAACRVLPLDLFTDEEDLAENPRLSPGAALEYGLDCDFSAQAPLLADASGIRDEELRNDYLAGRRALEAGLEYLSALPVQDAWLSHRDRKAPLALDWRPLLDRAKAKGAMDDNGARAFLEAQLALIDAFERRFEDATPDITSEARDRMETMWAFREAYSR